MDRAQRIVQHDLSSKRPDNPLLKAQKTFSSAEFLRERGHLDCAANRYYYAALHIAHHYVGWHHPTRKSRPEWHHAEIWEHCDKVVFGTQNVLGIAYHVRDEADYTPVPTSRIKLDMARSLVVKMVAEALGL